MNSKSTATISRKAESTRPFAWSDLNSRVILAMAVFNSAIVRTVFSSGPRKRSSCRSGSNRLINRLRLRLTVSTNVRFFAMSHLPAEPLDDRMIDGRDQMIPEGDLDQVPEP